MGAHINEKGEFQSDKYPSCPAGKVPLSVRDASAQDLLLEYARRRRPIDAEFSDDLEAALRKAGYEEKVQPPVKRVRINEYQVQLVSEALAKLNPVYDGKPEEARALIMQSIVEGADRRGFATSTGGHIVMFRYLANDDEADVEVFADLAVRTRSTRTSLELATLRVQPTPAPKPPCEPDEDGHCQLCGLRFWEREEDGESGRTRHECPPGFQCATCAMHRAEEADVPKCQHCGAIAYHWEILSGKPGCVHCYAKRLRAVEAERDALRAEAAKEGRTHT
jgi:hypothetical protein